MICIVLSGLLGCSLVGVVGCQPSPDMEPSSVSASARQDTFDIARFLVSRGYRFERVLPAHRPFHTGVVAAADGGRRRILVVRAGADSAHLLGGAVFLGDYTPQFVNWVRLPDSAVSGGPEGVLSVVFDDIVDNVIATHLFKMAGDSLQVFFSDEPDVCQPATFQDLDADGVPEFVRHGESPVPGNCGEPCALRIATRFHVQLGWLQVARWHADGLVDVAYEFPEFYSRMSRGYERMHDWLRSGEADAEECRTAYWLERDLSGMFARWAHRARELGDSMVQGRGSH